MVRVRAWTGAHTDASVSPKRIFGPAATGNEIIARFAPVMRSTDVIKPVDDFCMFREHSVQSPFAAMATLSPTPSQ